MDGTQHTAEEKLAAALRAAAVLIGYTPIGDEPRFNEFLKGKNVNALLFRLPPHREHSPHETAKTLSAEYAHKKVCVLVPGRRFDASGTRHGRGGGWYDRFLSDVPREWLRVGVLNHSQLSEIPLTRQSWDQPMDYLLLANAENAPRLSAEMNRRHEESAPGVGAPYPEKHHGGHPRKAPRLASGIDGRPVLLFKNNWHVIKTET